MDEYRRNTITVYLKADKRAKYHNFHCVYCGTKVGELNNTDVYQIRDIDDESIRPEKPGMAISCHGKFCRAWYSFNLN